MKLAELKNLERISFLVPRYDDKEVVERLIAITNEGNYTVARSSYTFIFSGNVLEYSENTGQDDLNGILALQTVSIFRAVYQLSNSLKITLERTTEPGTRKLVGNSDVIYLDPEGIDPIEFTKGIALTREKFDALDTKKFFDFLEEAPRAIYEARDKDLHRLERMQENFFQNMMKLISEQQKKQNEMQLALESDYSSRNKKLHDDDAVRRLKQDEQHQERLKQLETREDEIKRILAEIDDRDNRRARRDIYQELKNKLKARNTESELTKGTKRRRLVTTVFAGVLLIAFAAGFLYCFSRNVVAESTQINWVTVGSQIGFALAFLGMSTFFIKWNNQWFQKHASEEFKLKRLDLDIDRANWLVELALEWKNITASEIPPELVDKLSRSLFIADDSPEIDMHPAETILSAIFGKSGSLNIEVPGKLAIKRSEVLEKK